MPEIPPHVERMIRDEIDSVPHLEALLLLWRCAPTACSTAEIAEHLYVPHGAGAAIADDLHRRGLVVRDGNGRFFFDRGREELYRRIEELDATYRRELIRVSGIIHSKASPGIRAFADAFRFRKEKS